jgi:murein DD-endopeptidase MepM/ murein hydrolase activator NlpD
MGWRLGRQVLLAMLALACAPGIAGASILTVPVPAVPHPQGPYLPMAVEPHYGEGLDAGRHHEGQDLFAPLGTPLLAVSPAVVVAAGTGYSGGEGNHVAIFDPAADRTYNYFHMRSAPLVHMGQQVSAGERLGYLGCTGSCFGRHLHFEIRDGRGMYAEPYLDPAPFLHHLTLAPQPDIGAIRRLR